MAALALWSVHAFAMTGRGTPVPFDPPRRLVASGPYRYARNPMYIGVGCGLVGAALFYRSAALLACVALLAPASSLFIGFYEEPTLARMIGEEYAAYRARVRRWLPSWPGSDA